MGITCHYLDEDFKPLNFLLEILEVPGSHTSEKTEEVIQNSLEEYNILNLKNIFFTTDLGANMKKTFRTLM